MSLKEAIERSLILPEEILKNAKRAKGRILSIFSWDMVAKDHEKIFIQLLTKK
jgi:hypothetical protein